MIKRIKLLCLLFVAVSIVLPAQLIDINNRLKSKINYNVTFSNSVLNQGNLHKSHGNLSPMLDVGILVPNGGIFKFMPGCGWKSKNAEKLSVIFKESPYQQNSALRYNRYGWYTLENKKNSYLFDEVIEPLLQQALKEHSRVIIGLASMCGESSNMSQNYNGRRLAVPIYLFKSLQKTKYPMYEDSTYCNGYTANYDSPLLLIRYKALLKAFSKWLEGNLRGTTLKRRDLVYAIEMRYLGYWGEGTVPEKFYPSTSLIDQYLQAYVQYFPDKLLIGGGIEAERLPSNESYKKNPLKYRVIMEHISHLLTMRNKVGRIGLFIDSWCPYNMIYDTVSNRVIRDETGQVVPFPEYLKKNLWGQIYLTGEFGYFIENFSRNMKPYNNLYQQFSSRHISGISIHNFTVIDGEAKRKQYIEINDDIYMNARNCLSMVGYRIVLGSPSINKHANNYEIAFTLTNIGVSRMFHDYYKLHLITKDEKGNILNDYTSNLDLRTILPGKAEPLLYNPANGYLIKEHIPLIKGKLYLKIEDGIGIEYPMCLSNYGRQTDGSYFLGYLN